MAGLCVGVVSKSIYPRVAHLDAPGARALAGPGARHVTLSAMNVAQLVTMVTHAVIVVRRAGLVRVVVVVVVTGCARTLAPGPGAGIGRRTGGDTGRATRV